MPTDSSFHSGKITQPCIYFQYSLQEHHKLWTGLYTNAITITCPVPVDASPTEFTSFDALQGFYFRPYLPPTRTILKSLNQQRLNYHLKRFSSPRSAYGRRHHHLPGVHKRQPDDFPVLRLETEVLFNAHGTDGHLTAAGSSSASVEVRLAPERAGGEIPRFDDSRRV
jgi:hypothetical protein